MENLSPFEQGVLMSLISLAATLRTTPGFDGEALTKAAEYFINNPAAGCELGVSKEKYELPLAILKSDLSSLHAVLHEGKVKN
ncbi:hypothetical protein [Pseudomonas syringae]|uniref:hypothetical protein n=1 Tax=Pseudomonas syringae group TaxID=136849 RepID=UPI0010106A82|nr:hypothetical protein [Pseudomonas syringae]RXT61675.1 hypothetical protein B1F71_25675 [Pseudomonas syringae]RXT90985.1 hypothetical protein B1F75_20040 [Pseudomonas syringae]